MSRRIDIIHKGITGDLPVPSANEGIEVPDFALIAELLGHVSDDSGAPVVPLAWWGKLHATKTWIPISGAAKGNLVLLAGKAWLTEVSCVSFERLAPYVDSSNPTFTLDTYAIFRAR